MTLEEINAIHAKCVAGTLIIPDIKKYVGGIPAGYDLVVWPEEEGPEECLICHGFDEAYHLAVGREMKNPVFGFYPVFPLPH